MQNIIEYLLTKDIETSQNIFCKDNENTITYQYAIRAIKKIACFFAKNNIHNEPILLKAERNAKTLLSIFGVILSNNSFVPVNPVMPEEKIEMIISSSKIKYQIAFDKNEYCKNVTCFDFEDVLNTDIDEDCILALTKNFDENNDIYTIYTSGSTGIPKGVLKTQKNVISFVHNFIETFNFENNLKIANQAPLFFDASMKDIFLSIATNSTIFFPDKTTFAMPIKIVEYLNANQIDYICWVPSALTIIARLNTFKYVKSKFLKYVLFVGEVFLPKYLNMWLENLPDVKFVNTYGSTEIAGVCLYKVIDKQLPEDKPIPLGKPLKNNKVYLHDGEIIVESNQIAKCYTNSEEKNKKVFVNVDGKRLLKTGDYAMLNQDDDIVFLSRKDFQIKHMGYRIELQEIEISISSLPYISNCAVLFDAEKDKIVCFVSLNKKIEEPARVAMGDLREKLPAYMVPNKIVSLDELPLNFNGKINRTELQKRIKEI